VRRVRAFKREKSRRGQDGGRKNVHLEESVWLFFVNAPVCESLCFFGYEKKNYVKSCCALFKNVCGKCWLLNFLCLEKKMSLQGVYVNVSLGEKFCERKII
jgi:hypothetical protein